MNACATERQSISPSVITRVLLPVHRDSPNLVITEGEIDCLSVAQAFTEYKGRIYPCVSIPSASGTASVLAQRDWINTFETVILMLDQDEAGQKATDTIAKMIKAGKCKVAKQPKHTQHLSLIHI